jgi:type IV pilus assembly protein PilX
MSQRPPHILRGSPVGTTRSGCHGSQRGVVLVISLIMLVIISLLATLSIRSAVSSETVSGNVRTTMLAGQAAEIALRYCEEATVQIYSGTGTLPSLPVILDYAAPSRWQDTAANWDISTSPAFVVPAASVNQAGSVTFARFPECMIERMPVVDSAGTVSKTSTYIITARGFGPEVPAVDAARARPTGSEVWMQSTIELQ